MQNTQYVTLTSLGNNELINAQSQHRAMIMPLMSKKILANMVHMQYHLKLEWAASNGNRYPPYPQVMATAISQ